MSRKQIDRLERAAYWPAVAALVLLTICTTLALLNQAFPACSG